LFDSLSDSFGTVLAEPVFLTTILFLFGALFGSFANVVIYRMPLGKSIVSPGSSCQSCGKPVKWYNNVPILAWFWLRGRCASCGAKYSIRYALVELLMASLFAVAGYKLGLSWTLLEALLFIFGSVTASFIDLDHMILPDKFTLSGIVIGLIGAALNPDRGFLDAVWGVLAGGGFLWAVAYLYYAIRGREGMGGGDIKLLGWIGAVLGWKAIPVVILVSSIIGSIVGVMLALRTKEGMNHAIPFGPYLAGAALLYLLFGGQVWADWYLALHGL
jgi:leader peptidase (prepilin peptidase)/N-methyltransferase